jgi:hypothetical protein
VTSVPACIMNVEGGVNCPRVVCNDGVWCQCCRTLRLYCHKITQSILASHRHVVFFINLIFLKWTFFHFPRFHSSLFIFQDSYAINILFHVEPVCGITSNQCVAEEDLSIL